MRFHKLEEAILASPNSHSERHLGLLHKSQKFYMGSAEAIPVNGKINVAQFPRLPYLVCAFEFDMPNSCGAVVLCAEVTDFLFSEVWIRAGSAADCWIYAGAIRVNREEGYRQRLYPEKFGSNSDDPEITKALDQADKLLGLVGHALQVLNSVNIDTETVAAPAALNKKRIKAGKPALYSYKVLVLARSKVRAFPGAGTHNSPRIHLRRGHLKHRKTGTFWWQPHAVGDRKMGVVAKDYNAKRLVEQSSA